MAICQVILKIQIIRRFWQARPKIKEEIKNKYR